MSSDAFALGLRQAGQARGLSLRRLHRRVSPHHRCTLTSVWRWVHGRQLPPQEALIALLDAVEVQGEARRALLRAWLDAALHVDELRDVLPRATDAA